MWHEILPSGKVKYIERFTDPMTLKKHRFSVVLSSHSVRSEKDAARILQRKYEESIGKTKQSYMSLKAVQIAYIDEQSQQLRKSTWERNDRSLNAALRIIGEDVLVNQLTAGYIRTKLIASKKDAITLNNYIRRIKALIRWAYQNDYVESTQCIDKLSYFKEDNTKKEKLAEKFLEKHELALLLDSMHNQRWMLVTKILALSGMRIGELLALTRFDVNYKTHTISINKTYDSTNGVLENGAKTDTSNRELYMQPELEEAMKELADEQYILFRTHDIDTMPTLILFDANGSYASYFAYRKYLRENSEKVLHRAITPHCLRHTHVSLLAENGIPLDEISARLGHADSSITRDVYFHVTQRLEAQRRERMKAIKIL